MQNWAGPLFTALVMLAGCAERQSPQVPQSAPSAVTVGSRDGEFCRGLVDRFVGLPSAGQAATASASAEIIPLVGSWWIRRCSIAPADTGGLQVLLEGPGWYWVDSEDGDIVLHQQVPFDLSADLAGNLRGAYSRGVVSLWLEPTREANVAVKASTELELHGGTAWGSVLRRVPLLPVRSITADRLSDLATSAFRARLSRGMTVTYDVLQGQLDMALGQLPVGQTRRHAFEDGSSWITNERLLLPPVATQVFGPFEPLPLQLDVVIERGPGVAYRAVCTRDMAASLSVIAAGRPEQIPARTLVTSGTVTGSGSHTAPLEVRVCPYYLVVSSARAATTVAALRLRA